ncbi:hypothetical protein T484DRAFT_1761681 [Baffinella frigidus]|nr:hypothetical protein T484DRAFT_1761681 [Cryptophyta sp. CCMP2293]
MGDLAAIMARRRQMEDDAGEEGMYAPPSGGPRAAAAPQPRSAPRSAGRGPASAQRPLPSGQNGAVPAAPPSFLDLQEDEESEEEYDEGDDMAAQIAAYQQQLKAAGAPGSVAAPSPGPSQPSSFLPPQSNGSMAHNAAPASGYGGAPASGYGGAPASGYGGGNQGEQLFDNDVTEVGEVNLEADEGAEIAAYQLQLRSQDEADAVTGLACGNLQDVIASRGAPKSNSYSQPSSAGTGMGPSSYLSLSPDSQDGPTECTCDEDMAELCPYCTMINGPASNTTTASSLQQPDSSAAPSMPNSYSSYAGMPSQRHGRGKHCGEIPPGCMSPGSSEQQQAAALPGAGGSGSAETSGEDADGGTGAAAAPPLAGGAGTAHTSGVDVDGGKGGARQAGVKKKGGGFLCCFRPAVDEDEDVAPPHGATGGINGSRGIEGPSTNRTSGGTSGTNGDRVNSGKWSNGTAEDLVQDGVPLGDASDGTADDLVQDGVPLGGIMSDGTADDLVQDGVPLGGITSTSEDVIQLDHGGITSTSEDVIQLDHGTMLQCNVGLSIGDEHSQPEYAQPYPTHSAYDSPPSNGTIQSPQSDATIMGMSDATIMGIVTPNP